MWQSEVASMNVNERFYITRSSNYLTLLCTVIHQIIEHMSMHICLFVDTREHCDVLLSSEPFNSRHIPGLNQVNSLGFYIYYNSDFRACLLQLRYIYNTGGVLAYLWQTFLLIVFYYLSVLLVVCLSVCLLVCLSVHNSVKSNFS